MTVAIGRRRVKPVVETEASASRDPEDDEVLSQTLHPGLLAGPAHPAATRAGMIRRISMENDPSARWLYFSVAVLLVGLVATFGLLIRHIASAFK